MKEPKYQQTVLFLCSGNFYRSRFAEALFNHIALLGNLSWRAESRGFKPHIEEHDLSPHTRQALMNLRIPLTWTRSKPTRVDEADLIDASLIVAMCEREHRPLMKARFPDWEDRVRYWEVSDIDVDPPEIALSQAERLVRELAEQLENAPLNEPVFEF